MRIFLSLLSLLLFVHAGSQRAVGRGQIPFNGGSIHHFSAGAIFPNEEGKTVLFLHGGFQDERMWNGPVPVYVPSFRNIYIDLPGHGRSVKGAGRPGADSVVLAVLERFGLRKVTLVGLSLGSAVALEFASRHPERVEKLVLAAPGVAGWDEVATLDSATTGAFARMMGALERKDTAAAAAHFVQAWYVGPFRKAGALAPALYRYGLQTTLRNMRRHRVSGWVDFAKPATVHRIAQVSMPVLLLVGDKDMVETQRAAEWLRLHLPRARKIVFEGAAHMLNLEQPERFGAAVRDFLEAP